MPCSPRRGSSHTKSRISECGVRKSEPEFKTGGDVRLVQYGLAGFGIIVGRSRPHRVEMAVVDEETLVIWNLDRPATTINHLCGVVVDTLPDRIWELSAVVTDQWLSFTGNGIPIIYPGLYAPYRMSVTELPIICDYERKRLRSRMQTHLLLVREDRSKPTHRE